MDSNILILENRLKEIEEELTSLYDQLKTGKSPGLLKAISNVSMKRENILTSLELWRIMKVVYPNYDR